MKIKDDLMLRNIAGSWVVVPIGERLLEFNGMIKLNDTGAFIWRTLMQEKTKDELATALLEEYEIDEATAIGEIDAFLKELSEANVLES